MASGPDPLWLLDDGKAGNRSQLHGLAAALGLAGRGLRLVARRPWSALPPGLWTAAGPVHRIAGRLLAGEAPAPPWPRIVAGAGWRTGPATLWIGARGRAARPDGTLTVQLQDCGIDPAYFDVVAVPRHDPLRGANVVVTEGALHKVTPAALAAAAAAAPARLRALPRPRVAVLIGGDSRAYRLDRDTAAALGSRLARLAASTGAGLMATVSRRTSPAAAEALRAGLAGQDAPNQGAPDQSGPEPATIAFWDGAGDNPYLAYLALADALVVTGDSVSMLSEAAATGKPVHLVDLPGGSDKFARFHANFARLGITRPFADRLEEWRYDPPDDADRVARAIRARLGPPEGPAG